MRPLVYHGGFASVAFFAAFGVWLVGEAILQALPGSRDARDPTYMRMLVGSLLGVGLAFAAANAGARLPGPGWVPVAVGLPLLVLGLALRAWSVLTLGRFYRVTVAVADDQPLVDTGPYAVVRHPAYTGMLLSCLGLGIALDSWLSLAAAAILPTLGVLQRIGHEEAILTSELGAQYKSYKTRTKRLLPGLW